METNKNNTTKNKEDEKGWKKDLFGFKPFLRFEKR